VEEYPLPGKPVEKCYVHQFCHALHYSGARYKKDGNASGYVAYHRRKRGFGRWTAKMRFVCGLYVVDG
jgi:hypothetical protein